VVGIGEVLDVDEGADGAALAARGRTLVYAVSRVAAAATERCFDAKRAKSGSRSVEAQWAAEAHDCYR
jgi:hypothetical protein